MAGSIKGIIVEIGGDTSGLQKALSKVNSATSSLSKELTGINRLLKLDPKNTELLSQKQEVLSESIETTKNKLNQLKDIQAKAIEAEKNGAKISDENWRALQKNIESTQIKLNKLLLEQNGWNVSGKKIEEFGEKIVKVSSKIDNLGSKLTKTLTTSVLALGVVSGKSAIDFETAFAGVEKTVDGTAEQMANLKQGIKDMSKEIPSSTTEISAVAEAAGQLGIQTDNILSFSKVMIDMGNSTNLASDEAASSLARFANITEMSQKDFSKLGAAIVDLGNNFATTESEIVDMSLRLAGAGHQIGMSEGEILGLATALSSVGIEAEMGGSALSKAMVKMQNAVEMGGNKLDTVLKKTGMTLRELELLSANNSMDFKALADSIGMTSTEVKQLITAGTNLEDFANISGMSAEQFKKAWKDDATGALTSFIKGLGDAESKGESAITMLSEMGLTETRLRDSLLRAANAGNLFNNAIETGNKAWQENTALTNEANKRYATTESRIKTTINKLKDFGTTVGNKLLPSINRIIDSSEKWIKKLDNLDDATLDNIIRVGLFVAATGPLLKIIGKLGTGLGTVIKTFGQFKQAIAVINTGAKSTSASVNLLASGITKLISPMGLATLGVGYLVTAWNLATKKAKEQTEEVKELTDSINEEIKARISVTDAVEEQMQANLSEITNIQTLKNELLKLVDENGKVKEGYKSRVDFILNELNKALGTEYTATGDIINNYKELTSTIDELIAKKRAQIVLEADEEKYKEALKNKTAAYETYLDIQNKIAEKEKEIADFREMHKYAMNTADVSNYKELQKQLDELTTSLSNSESEINKYNNTITRYEKNSEMVIKGGLENYQKVYSSIVELEENTTKTNEKEMTKRLANLQESVNKSIELYNLEAEKNKGTKENIYAANVEQSRKNLQLLVDELIAMSNTTGEMSADVIEAWKNLAINSRQEYNNAISQMPQDMQDRINNITGIVTSDKSVSNATNGLALAAVEKFNKEKEAEEAGKNLIKGVNSGINNQTEQAKAKNSASIFSSAILGIIHKIWDEHSPSRASEKSAINLIKGIPIGIKKEAPKAYKEVEKTASNILNAFNSNLNFESLQNIPKLQNSISQTINTQLKPKILSPTINIITQRLDNNEMSRIIDTVNRKLGEIY